MKIEKLPSGSYRIRQQYKGKRYTVIVPYKPTQKEAIQLMAEQFNTSESKVEHLGTFSEYASKYLTKCEEDNLSPSTINGYASIIRRLPEWFMQLRFSDIEQTDIQRLCDEYSESHSPKSVRLYHGFVRSVFVKYRPQFTYSVTLPSMVKKAEYEPTTEDIQRILAAATGSRYEIVLRLCSLAVRRGEAIAITASDLDKDNVLTINKDIVVDKNNKYVLKNKPKTEASNRRILLPSTLADQIRAQGYAFKGNPHTINEYLHKLQDRLEIPRFKLHMLRHFAAAYLHKEGFTDQQILSWGGWENGSDVMQRVYRYNLDPHESQKTIADSFGNIF